MFKILSLFSFLILNVSSFNSVYPDIRIFKGKKPKTTIIFNRLWKRCFFNIFRLKVVCRLIAISPFVFILTRTTPPSVYDLKTFKIFFSPRQSVFSWILFLCVSIPRRCAIAISFPPPVVMWPNRYCVLCPLTKPVTGGRAAIPHRFLKLLRR